MPESITSKPYWPLPETKLLSKRLLTLVLLMACPFAPVLVSTMPFQQLLTSTCSTSTCQFSRRIPSVLPDPLQLMVRSRMASGSPVVLSLST